MPTMKRGSAWHLTASIAFAGSVAAQNQPAPPVDPKTITPARTTPGTDHQPGPRLPGSGRDQFFSPVMGIDIKGEGLALPPGVAQSEEPIKPPAPPAEPPATAK